MDWTNRAVPWGTEFGGIVYLFSQSCLKIVIELTSFNCFSLINCSLDNISYKLTFNKDFVAFSLAVFLHEKCQ